MKNKKKRSRHGILLKRPSLLIQLQLLYKKGKKLERIKRRKLRNGSFMSNLISTVPAKNSQKKQRTKESEIIERSPIERFLQK